MSQADIDKFKELAEQFKNMKSQSGTCPNCGYCPHCGRGYWGTQPWGPGWHPYSPPVWYETPYYLQGPTCISGTAIFDISRN